MASRTKMANTIYPVKFKARNTINVQRKFWPATKIETQHYNL